MLGEYITLKLLKFRNHNKDLRKTILRFENTYRRDFYLKLPWVKCVCGKEQLCICKSKKKKKNSNKVSYLNDIKFLAGHKNLAIQAVSKHLM